MASITPDATTAKMSFAKVAASGYLTHVSNQLSNAPATSNLSQEPHFRLRNAPHAPNGDQHSAQKSTVTSAYSSVPSVERMTGTAPEGARAEPGAPDQVSKELDVRGPTDGLLRAVVADDNNTQLSSSGSSAMPASLDGKSVASRTTFALDEKESLRPDDSASVKAVEEDDTFSPSGSIAAGSRGGSDSGARAFRDQLHEISVMGPLPQRGPPAMRFNPPANQSGGAIYVPTSASGAVQTVLPPGAVVNAGVVGGIAPVPDEKLVEALAKPQERLWVLKLEQDIVDFLNSSKESSLELPQCNSFYRLLAHRLADYYSLGHIVDPSLTAVRLYKIPPHSLPPPISSFFNASTMNTPPPVVTAKKIMRRGGEIGGSGSNTAANSQGASKTTSDAGGESGSDEGQKNKGPQTREERQAKYNEVRQRIFGDMEDSETADVTNEAKDPSRSSSAGGNAVGKKKGKKQRNNNDDEFEARSAYNAYYATSYSAGLYPSIPGDATYYGAYPVGAQPAQYIAPSPGHAMQQPYGTLYPQMMQQDPSQYSWSPPGYEAGFSGLNLQQAYDQTPQQSAADLSTAFHRGMSLRSPNMHGQASPQRSNPVIGSYQGNHQPQTQSVNPSYHPISFQSQGPDRSQSPYRVPQAQFGHMSPSYYNRPTSSPGHSLPQSPYPYGQLPSAGHQNNKQVRSQQHPLPGSFNRPQFNPQSQAFVPGGQMGSYPAQSYSSHMNLAIPSTSNFPSFNPMPSQLQRQSSSHSQASSFGSPHLSQINSSIQRSNGQSMSHPLPQPVFTPTSSASHTPAPVATGQSSIAKYGAAASLPPKPPPPVEGIQIPKFGEGQRAMPSYNYPATARLPSNPMAGFNRTGPLVGSVRGGDTQSSRNAS
ncbi:hypothetical protein LTR04_002561 [Oleoguttula sp. CCFEE 6159]|nr:hypothetical protein LTR04_002561 [Oleoguttula sp. CCFEE 6159]